MPENSTFISFYLPRNTFRVFIKAIRALEKPTYVRFLINPDTFMMAMEDYGEKKFTSFRVSRKLLEGSRSDSLRIHSKKFCELIARQMKWDMRKSYRIEGKIYPEQKIVVYSLMSAQEIKGKPPANLP